MGRAGGGGGGRSGGFHSSSRSSGSHRSSSSRAGSSSFGSSSSRGSSFGHSSHSYHGSSYHGGGYHGGHYGGPYHYAPTRRNGCLSTLLTFATLLFLIVVLINTLNPSVATKSTIERTKLESGLAYDNDVVLTDEIGWVESKDKVGRELRKFWDKTGVQPYIMLLRYDENLRTDAQKEAYTEELYEQYIDREDALLFVYYGERDVENDVGLMCYTLGKQATSVFDGEAIDIWFNYIDKYWYGSYTTTDVFISAYNNTAKTIMSAPTNFWDFGKVAVIVLAVILVAMIAYKALKSKFKRDKEKVAETERILNASMNTLTESKTDSDDLLDKYNK